MTHYYYDADNNVFYHIDRMPPREPESNEEMISDKGLQKEWGEFYIYLLGRPKEPHTFSGHSRVVPEGEIRWELQMLSYDEKTWVKASHTEAELDYIKRPRRRVATPKITEGEKAIPAHVGDEPKCVMGCKTFTGGEKQHHKDCAFYEGSMSQKLDSLTAQPDKQEEEEEESLLDIAKSMYESARKLLEQLKNG